MKPGSGQVGACAECGTPVLPGGEAGGQGPTARCGNPDCPAQVRSRIAHWCSREAMDIAVCGEAQVRLLVGSGLVLDVADLYRLRLAEVAGVEEKGSGFARELMEGLAASKTRELWRLIFGLGIPGVDRGTAQALAGAWPALDDLLGAGRDQLVQVGGVSGRAADNLVQWHGDPRNRRIVKQLRKAGLNFGV